MAGRNQICSRASAPFTALTNIPRCVPLLRSVLRTNRTIVLLQGLPPTKVAYDLKEFIEHVCLGVRMQELGLKRYEEPKDKPGFANKIRNYVEDDAEPVGDEDDDWTSSEEEEGEAEKKVEVAETSQRAPIKPLFKGEFEAPVRLFKPFSQGLN